MMNPRRTAVEVLETMSRTGEFSSAILERFAAGPARDRNLLSGIVTGVVRHRGTLDYLIHRISGREPRRIAPLVRQILRSAFYQAVYLDRVPDYAIANESVELARGTCGGRAAGFINAVVRKAFASIERKGATIVPGEDRAIAITKGRGTKIKERVPWPADVIARLSLQYSCPEGLVQRWWRRYGRERTLEILEGALAPKRTTIRANLRKGTRKALISALEKRGIRAREGGNEFSVILSAPGNLFELDLFREGWFQPQDEASMAVGIACAPVEGERILDLCAAPGAKATHLMEIQPRVSLVAADVSPERACTIVEMRNRLGHAGIRVAVADGRRPPWDGAFDLVLVDAPCSNTGVLARRPEAKWRFRESRLSKLSDLQSALLRGALRSVRPGGRIVYSTCSIEPEENEHVVQRFLQEQPGLILDGTELRLPSAGRAGGFWARIRCPKL